MQNVFCQFKLPTQIGIKYRGIVRWKNITCLLNMESIRISPKFSLKKLLNDRFISSTWTNAELLSIGLTETHLGNTKQNQRQFFKKCDIKMSSTKWSPFCSGHNVSTFNSYDEMNTWCMLWTQTHTLEWQACILFCCIWLYYCNRFGAHEPSFVCVLLLFDITRVFISLLNFQLNCSAFGNRYFLWQRKLIECQCTTPSWI